MGVLEIAGLINIQFPTCQKEKTKGIQEPTNMLPCSGGGMEHGKTMVTSDMNSSGR